MDLCRENTILRNRVGALEKRVLELEHEQADMCLVSYLQGVEDGVLMGFRGWVDR